MFISSFLLPSDPYYHAKNQFSCQYSNDLLQLPEDSCGPAYAKLEEHHSYPSGVRGVRHRFRGSRGVLSTSKRSKPTNSILDHNESGSRFRVSLVHRSR